ncbi:hypothetical protein CCACVL1_00591, partial [Corchorus capsularis]
EVPRIEFLSYIDRTNNITLFQITAEPFHY